MTRLFRSARNDITLHKHQNGSPLDVRGQEAALAAVRHCLDASAEAQQTRSARGGVAIILQRLAAPAPVLSAADPTVLTDANGRFSFDTPPPGRHQLLLLHPNLGWLIAQGAEPGPPIRLIFDGKTRVIDIGRR